MNIEQKVNMALAYKGISQAELARRMGMTPANFNKRLKVGKFSNEEIIKIAECLEAKYIEYFEFPDGTKI